MSNNSKLRKVTEKWWLALVVLFYLLYNIPYYPEYGDSTAALWHGALTLIPLWIVVYVGLFRLSSLRQLDEDAICREFNDEGEDINDVR